jgi:predicted permease
MHLLPSLFRSIVRRERVEQEMHDEMALHLERATERFMQRGMSERDARLAARREFGNVAYLQEEARDARGTRWVDALRGDVRFALRHFARTPGTTTTIILVLALGIGVNAAVFSLFHALTMRPAPGVPSAHALVRIRGIAHTRAEGRLRPRTFSLPEVNDLAAHRETFSSVAGFAGETMVLDAGEGHEPSTTRAHFVTANYFATLGIRPAFGVGLPVRRANDAAGTELAVMLAHSLWVDLGADSSIVGRVVRLNDVPVRVVAVAPPLFHGPIRGPDKRAWVWLPLDARAALTRGSAFALASRDSTLLEAFARLAPSATLDHANALVRVIADRQRPVTQVGTEYSSDVVRLRGETDLTTGDAVGMGAVMMTGALLVLLIACTNVSALIVGAAVTRRREIAIRLSLGASRARVVRQLVTESSLIALAGGALGLTLFWWAMKLVTWFYMDPEFTPDLATAAFTTIVSLGTGIVFGLSPALHATKLDVANALKDTGSGITSRARLQRAFIVAQIGLTQPLLVALAMVIGVVISETDARGFDPTAHYVSRIRFGGFTSDGAEGVKRAKVASFMERVAQLPGVEAMVPDAAGFDRADLRVRAGEVGAGPRATESVRAHVEGAAPGYFAAQRIPMLRGREAIASDTASDEMAIVIDSDMARGFWGSADPIGRRLDLTSRFYRLTRTAVVVGVFDAARSTSRGEGRIYTADGAHWRGETFLVRTRGGGNTLAPAMRRLALSTMPDVPITQISTIEDIARQDRRDILLVSASAAAGGLVALLLASIGLYGVVALAVRERHREIGIRVALGARPDQVVRVFLSSGVKLSAIGIAIGLPFSVIALNVLVSSFNSEVPINMPLVGASIALVVIGVASVATWIPARKAAGVDPLTAIRVD